MTKLFEHNNLIMENTAKKIIFSVKLCFPTEMKTTTGGRRQYKQQCIIYDTRMGFVRYISLILYNVRLISPKSLIAATLTARQTKKNVF